MVFQVVFKDRSFVLVLTNELGDIPNQKRHSVCGVIDSFALGRSKKSCHFTLENEEMRESSLLCA